MVVVLVELRYGLLIGEYAFEHVCICVNIDIWMYE